MKQIPLTQGKFALVDDADFDRLSVHKWHTVRRRHTCYASRQTAGSHATRRRVYMHAEIAGTTTGGFTDHIDGNGLNNVRSNLRVTDNRGNQYNQTHKAFGKSSRFRGVSRCRKGWVASIKDRDEHKRLGYFSDEFAAAAAYDVAGIARDPEHFTPNFSASWLAPKVTQ